MVKGLLIEIKNWSTGERSYGIDPRNPNLKTLAGPLWQCLDHEPKGDWEIRVVVDGQPPNYEGKIILDDGGEVYHATDIPADSTIVDVDGAIVLDGDAEINLVLDHLPAKIYGRVDDVQTWAESRGVTPKGVEDEIKAAVKSVEKPGHVRTSVKRKKPVENVVFGDTPYAFLKKIHDLGCPHTWRAMIPRV